MYMLGLQEGSRSTIIIFDLKEKKMRIGGLAWAPVRVLQVETKFDSLKLAVDKDFMQSVGLPGMEVYDSQDSPQSDAEDAPGMEGEELAAAGMVVPFEPQTELEEALRTLVLEALEEEEEQNDATDEEAEETPGMELVDLDTEGMIKVELDVFGNLIASHEGVELVEHNFSISQIGSLGPKNKTISSI